MSTQPAEFNTLHPPLDFARPAFLMCPPTLYEVSYVINPWMAGNIHASSRDLALAQWKSLYEAVDGIAQVELIEPQPGLPDMVFTANAGLEHKGTVVLSSFFHRERQGEENHFHEWFRSAGYNVLDTPRSAPFEGEGDALFSADGSRLWAGYGQRTSLTSHEVLRGAWNIEVIPLRLVDPRFYHLDTCFAPLEDGSAMYYPGAFDRQSLRKIEEFYTPEQRILVEEADALRFACNVVSTGRFVILNKISDTLCERLKERDLEVIQTTLSEFMKAGGAAKCLVMRLSRMRDEQAIRAPRPARDRTRAA